ncbi:MAG: hypothetical protein WC565_09420 [Parcubacteria group bacterium]|jgi:hypothetical protein
MTVDACVVRNESIFAACEQEVARTKRVSRRTWGALFAANLNCAAGLGVFLTAYRTGLVTISPESAAKMYPALQRLRTAMQKLRERSLLVLVPLSLSSRLLAILNDALEDTTVARDIAKRLDLDSTDGEEWLDWKTALHRDT